MSWLDKFIGHVIQAAGTALTQRQYLNFTNATVADNPTTQATDVTMPGQGALALTLKTYAASPANITLTAAEAIADMVILTGAPGDDVHTLTFPLVSGGFTPRVDGTRMLIFNSTGHTITMTDPWGNVIVLLTSSTFELVWSPTAGSMSIMFVGPTSLRALNNTVGTTRGTILYCSATGWTTLPMGTTGQVLKATTGGDPFWG